MKDRQVRFSLFLCLTVRDDVLRSYIMMMMSVRSGRNEHCPRGVRVCACVSLCYQTALPHYYCVVIDVVLRCFPSVQVVDLLFSFLVTHLNIICMIWVSCNLSLSLSVWKLLLISTSSFFLVSKDQLSFVAALTSVALTSTLYFYLGVFILCCYSILTVDCLILLKYRNMHFITLNSF